MPTALKTKNGRVLEPYHASANDNHRAAPLGGSEPQLDDGPMLIVYAFSAILMVVGLFLLSAA